MKAYPLANLVLDFEIYPRKQIDSHHVDCILDAMRAGAEMPPLVIDQKSKRIVDGMHRYRAYERISDHDPTYEVQCIQKQYRNEAELFVDAMRYNATHGRALTKFDRTYCMMKAKDLHVSDKDLAKVLHVPQNRISELVADRTATRKNNGDQEMVPIKNTIRHKAGQTLTDQQVECNAKLSGMQQAFYVNQVIMLIESELLNTEDERLMERLKVLADLLSNVV